MKTAPWVTRSLAAVVLAGGVMRTAVCPAAEAPESFIESTPDLTCDEFNRSWKVVNQHSYFSIKVTIRWQAVGGRQMQEEFILPPREGRGLGCAPGVEIVSAEFMDF